ncbi:MAG: hypothetical protein HYW48_00705 [Deltaproteobacteria bacterium]|nr:hypothetical protein [Deltaproteobacteria bacterium]
MTLKTVVELQYVDVEGEGGFSHQDSGVNKVATRSPQVGLDKAAFSLQFPIRPALDYAVEAKFTDSSAHIDRHYFTFRLPSLNTKFELGKNRPFIKTDRRTEVYPLIGTAYWRNRQYHLVSETQFELNSLNLTFNASLAQQRHLGTREAAKDPSFKMLVYDDGPPKDGQTFEGGAGLSVQYRPLKLAAWGFRGTLIDDFDWKNQLSQSIQHYDDLGDKTDRTHFWIGSRLDFDLASWHLRGEIIKSQDGLLPRHGYYWEASYLLELPGTYLIHSIEPLFRSDTLKIGGVSPQLANPLTWDRAMKTLAIILGLDRHLALNIEYCLLEEETGSALSVRDDQFLVRLKMEI